MNKIILKQKTVNRLYSSLFIITFLTFIGTVLLFSSCTSCSPSGRRSQQKKIELQKSVSVTPIVIDTFYIVNNLDNSHIRVIVKDAENVQINYPNNYTVKEN